MAKNGAFLKAAAVASAVVYLGGGDPARRDLMTLTPIPDLFISSAFADAVHRSAVYACVQAVQLGRSCAP
jgi:hypothetical protein